MKKLVKIGSFAVLALCISVSAVLLTACGGGGIKFNNDIRNLKAQSGMDDGTSILVTWETPSSVWEALIKEMMDFSEDDRFELEREETRFMGTQIRFQKDGATSWSNNWDDNKPSLANFLNTESDWHKTLHGGIGYSPVDSAKIGKEENDAVIVAALEKDAKYHVEARGVWATVKEQAHTVGSWGADREVTEVVSLTFGKVARATTTAHKAVGVESVTAAQHATTKTTLEVTVNAVAKVAGDVDVTRLEMRLYKLGKESDATESPAVAFAAATLVGEVKNITFTDAEKTAFNATTAGKYETTFTGLTVGDFVVVVTAFNEHGEIRTISTALIEIASIT